MNGMRTYRLINGRAVSISMEDCFPFLKERGHVISLVGAGGKTTLMCHLAQRFAERGMKTAVMTTTKILRPRQFAKTIGECRAFWAAGEYAVCGEEAPQDKLCAPKEEVIAALLEEADAVLIEADGAKHMALKAPAEHEPVILPQTDIVIGVAGVQVLGKPVETVCFRQERVQALLGCDGAHRLTTDDLARLMLSTEGTRKAVGNREYYAVINKCDDEMWLEKGAEAARTLESREHLRTVLACLKPKEIRNK